MSAQLLDLLNPFLTSGVATFALLYYFLKPEHHKLKTEQILLFWFLASAVFFFIPYVPSRIALPFAYFGVQTAVVYLLLRYYWRVKEKESIKLTFVFFGVNLLLIGVFAFLFKGIV